MSDNYGPCICPTSHVKCFACCMRSWDEPPTPEPNPTLTSANVSRLREAKTTEESA